MSLYHVSVESTYPNNIMFLWRETQVSLYHVSAKEVSLLLAFPKYVFYGKEVENLCLTFSFTVSLVRSNVAKAILWLIWMERNDRIFKDKFNSFWYFCEFVQIMASNWRSQHKSFCNYSTFTINLDWKCFCNLPASGMGPLVPLLARLFSFVPVFWGG